MTDRPIIFSSAMVRALLDGRKTQTRRVLKPQPSADMGLIGIYAPKLTAVFGYETPDADYKVTLRYMPGDRLWVRESIDKMSERGDDRIGYKADWPGDGTGLGWRPSIHMPRWASRLTLTVTDVRVQRLQEISQEDAIAEGPGFIGKITGEVCESAASHRLGIGPRWRTPRDWYADLWDSINADRGFGWETNPWVVAVTFRVIKQNIDSTKEIAA